MRLIIVFAGLALSNASGAATLSNARRVGSNFEFSVTSDANAIYAVEASSNLTNWSPVLTNGQLGGVRTIAVPATDLQGFYRVRSIQPLFTGAMGVRESVEFAGSGVTVVSFDSRDPRYFQPDGTRDRTRFLDRGDITTTSEVTNSLDLGNAKVYGHVRGPRDGLVVLGPGGVVGSLIWHLNSVGIEPGWYLEETNRIFVDAELPQGHVYVTPEPGSVDGTNYTYVLSNGHYTLPELRMGNSNRVMLVTGRATLYVSDFFTLQPPAKIVIERNASLDVYVGAGSATIGISAVVNNNPGAAAFVYYGLPGNTNVSAGANGFFSGTFYAPSANITFGGGGNDEAEISGAIVGRNIKVNGKLNMHYDEALRVAGPAW